MNKLKTLIAALLLGTGLAGSAHAALLHGKEVGFTYYFTDTSVPYDQAGNGVQTVGDGVEFSNMLTFIHLFPITQLDISDSNLLITFPAIPAEYAEYLPPTNTLAFAGFNGFVIHDAANQIDAFTSVTINALSNLAGFDMSRIDHDADHIWINWQGLPYIPGTTILSLDINADGQTVPEPGTLVLLGLSLMLMAFAWQRKA